MKTLIKVHKLTKGYLIEYDVYSLFFATLEGVLDSLPEILTDQDRQKDNPLEEKK